MPRKELRITIGGKPFVDVQWGSSTPEKGKWDNIAKEVKKRFQVELRLKDWKRIEEVGSFERLGERLHIFQVISNPPSGLLCVFDGQGKEVGRIWAYFYPKQASAEVLQLGILPEDYRPKSIAEHEFLKDQNRENGLAALVELIESGKLQGVVAHLSVEGGNSHWEHMKEHFRGNSNILPINYQAWGSSFPLWAAQHGIEETDKPKWDQRAQYISDSLSAAYKTGLVSELPSFEFQGERLHIFSAVKFEFDSEIIVDFLVFNDLGEEIVEIEGSVPNGTNSFELRYHGHRPEFHQPLHFVTNAEALQDDPPRFPVGRAVLKHLMNSGIISEVVVSSDHTFYDHVVADAAAIAEVLSSSEDNVSDEFPNNSASVSGHSS